ncbi:MAG: LacI family DNA-binding transcriptional regulator [Anaerolineaceae bacterium]|nr:LacI family DNA-binding transcriptional regulator [Anaerolineaceae bacterium]
MALSTLKDVAREAGVSITLVSMCVNGKPGVSKATQEKIATAIERVGYTPRRVKKSEHSNLIAILMENLTFPAFSDVLYLPLLQGFENEARRLGYHMVISTIDIKSDLEIPPAILKNEFVGVAAFGGGDLTDKFLRSIAGTGVPLLLVDNYLLDGEMDAIVPDNEIGGYFATRHLIDRGYDPIAVFQGPAKYKTLTDRLQGYMRAMLEAGRYPEPWQIQPYLSKGNPRKGYLEMKAMLSRPKPPRAVFCISDRAAFGAMAAVQEVGLRMPEDIALVGFDDTPEGLHSSPPLTSVHMPKREMGIEAARRLIQTIEHSTEMEDAPLKITLPVFLVERASS